MGTLRLQSTRRGPGGASADDGYVKAKLGVALQVLADLKYVLKEEVAWSLTSPKTPILPKGITQGGCVCCSTEHHRLQPLPRCPQRERLPRLLRS
jgi:hypothetical protein